MYIGNKYCRCYFTIINNAQNQHRQKGLGKYFESHHIYPISINPEYRTSKWNNVLLTAREHFICHHLLTKFTKNKYKIKMMLGYIMMVNRKSPNQVDRRNKLTSRDFQRAKEFNFIVSKQRRHTDKTKSQIKESLDLYYSIPANLERIREIRKNTIISDKTRELIGRNSKEMWDNMSDNQYKTICESRRGQGNANFGNKMSDESKNKISKANKGNTYCKGIIQKRRTCPHCGKTGGNTMSRWHFDNCKDKK